MINRLFGNYLVEKKVLTQTQLDDLLPVQKDFKAEVETIAVINKSDISGSGTGAFGTDR